MAGVTPQGWETTTVDQEVEALRLLAEASYGTDVPTTPDSRLGQTLNILAETIKRVYDLGSAITDTQNLSTATGIYLDYFAEHKGTSRLRESGSYGLLSVFAPQGQVIPAFTTFEDTSKRKVVSDESLTISRLECFQAKIEVLNVVNSNTYTVTVNNSDYNYISDVDATEDEILSSLVTALSAGSSVFSVERIDSHLILTNVSRTNDLSVSVSPDLLIPFSAGLVRATAVEVGALTFPANSINKVTLNNFNIDRVSNPVTFTLGRLTESDYELRIRLLSLKTALGKATSFALKSAVTSVAGVTGVVYQENRELFQVGSRPAKTFELYVTGGDANEIAQAILDTAPATINSHGDVQINLPDVEGDLVPVKFSRRTQKFGWVRVTYVLNTEEDFPVTGESDMQSAVISFGNNMYAGENLTPNKFFAPCYQTRGMVVTNIEVALTDNDTDTPSWSTSEIAIPNTEDLAFTETTVIVQT